MSDSSNGNLDTYLGNLFFVLQSLGQRHVDALDFTSRHVPRQPKSIDLVSQVNIRHGRLVHGGPEVLQDLTQESV